MSPIPPGVGIMSLHLIQVQPPMSHNLLARRSDAHQVTLVCTSDCETARHLVPFGDHIFTRHMKVGEKGLDYEG